MADERERIEGTEEAGGGTEQAGGDQQADARQESGDQQADVMLKVPRVNVDELELDVDDLSAHVSLDATVAERLVHIRAGVDVDLHSVDLLLKGVETEADLRVKLDNIARIAEQALSLLRERAEIAEVVGSTTLATAAKKLSPARPAKQLAGTARRAVGEVRDSRAVKRIRETPKAAARKLAHGLERVTHMLPVVSQGAGQGPERRRAQPQPPAGGDEAGGAAHARTDGWSGLPGV